MFKSGGEPRGPVGSGIDCFLMQDNTILGYSTDMRVREDWNVEGVTSLGYFGYRDLLSMGYRCDFDLNSYLLKGADVAGSLSRPGWQSDGNCNINSSGLYTFTALSVHDLTVLFTIMGAQLASGNLDVAVGSLLRSGTAWMAKMLLPGLQTS